MERASTPRSRIGSSIRLRAPLALPPGERAHLRGDVVGEGVMEGGREVAFGRLDVDIRDAQKCAARTPSVRRRRDRER